MQNPSGWSVRPYQPSDLDAIYEIALRTGAAGADASEMVDDPRLFGELFAAPHVTLEPEHAFVLDDGRGRTIGYVVGALDAAAFEARCEREWWPALRSRHPLDDGGTKLDDLLIGLIHHRPAPDPEVDGPHPSELHINLLPEAQGQGWGRAMIERLLASLRSHGSPGVHLGTSPDNTRAIAFYRHLGFQQLADSGHSVRFGMRL